MKTRIVPYDSEFLDLSYHWFEDSSLRRLTNTDMITRDQQLKWYNSLVCRNDYKVWGVEHNGEKVGVCGLKHITAEDAEYFGFIGDRSNRGKGIGDNIMDLVVSVSIDMRLSSIWLSVLCENIPARKLYIKKGFVQESKKGALLIMRKLLVYSEL